MNIRYQVEEIVKKNWSNVDDLVDEIYNLIVELYYCIEESRDDC